MTYNVLSGTLTLSHLLSTEVDSWGGVARAIVLSNKVDITFDVDFYYFYDYYSAPSSKT